MKRFWLIVVTGSLVALAPGGLPPAGLHHPPGGLAVRQGRGGIMEVDHGSNRGE